MTTGRDRRGFAHDFYCTHDPCRCRPVGLTRGELAWSVVFLVGMASVFLLLRWVLP